MQVFFVVTKQNLVDHLKAVNSFDNLQCYQLDSKRQLVCIEPGTNPYYYIKKVQKYQKIDRINYFAPAISHTHSGPRHFYHFGFLYQQKVEALSDGFNSFTDHTVLSMPEPTDINSEWIEDTLKIIDAIEPYAYEWYYLAEKESLPMQCIFYCQRTLQPHLNLAQIEELAATAAQEDHKNHPASGDPPKKEHNQLESLFDNNQLHWTTSMRSKIKSVFESSNNQRFFEQVNLALSEVNEGSPKEKAAYLLKRIEQNQNPELSKIIHELEELRAEFSDRNLSLHWDNTLEKKEIKLTISGKSIRDFEDAKTRLNLDLIGQIIKKLNGAIS